MVSFVHTRSLSTEHELGRSERPTDNTDHAPGIFRVSRRRPEQGAHVSREHSLLAGLEHNIRRLIESLQRPDKTLAIGGYHDNSICKRRSMSRLSASSVVCALDAMHALPFADFDHTKRDYRSYDKKVSFIVQAYV